jgi:ribosomal protein L37AE/L43A
MSVFTSSLRKQINNAFQTAQNRRAAKYACPSCNKAMALVTLSGAGIIIGQMCRFCTYHTFGQSNDKRGAGKSIEKSK